LLAVLGSSERKWPGFGLLVLLSVWSGLVAGLLEVGAIVLRKQFFDPNQLYDTSRHFVWLTPVTNMCLFAPLGLAGWGLGVVWPRRGAPIVRRILCTLVLLPMVLVALSQLYGLACLALTSGMASALVGFFERQPTVFRRLTQAGVPVVFGAVAILAISPWVADANKQIREGARPAPAAGSSNVLLLVMDTVGAGHSSLHGYERPTNTSLVEYAEQGIRFDAAQAASSWTLPSHAALFTGRSLHELSVGWLHPLDRAHPTLAEFLGERGYATAGFVANIRYCASDSGLDRGFTHYEDYVFPGLTAFKMSVLVSRALAGIQPALEFVADGPQFGWVRPYLNEFWRQLVDDRKDAAVVNRQLIEWLSSRSEPERPFFAFCNYYDAHHPYRLKAGRIRRFGEAPTGRQRGLIQNWFDIDKTQLSVEEVAFARAAYDDCIADLDEQIGKLLDELRRRGVLEKTWVIVTSDHGESFGEHGGVFCHGSSLYQSEVHVPLVIIPPGGRKSALAVKETVSLVDLPVTIVEVLGMSVGARFPGNSLARFWERTASDSRGGGGSTTPALAEVVPDDSMNHDSLGLPKKTWPLGTVSAERWAYIRREGHVVEELYDLRVDPMQRRNLASDPDSELTLERMRDALGRLTGGPLMPWRFRR
jgi:arylsulfatase A-like enzyme